MPTLTMTWNKNLGITLDASPSPALKQNSRNNQVFLVASESGSMTVRFFDFTLPSVDPLIAPKLTNAGQPFEVLANGSPRFVHFTSNDSIKVLNGDNFTDVNALVLDSNVEQKIDILFESKEAWIALKETSSSTNFKIYYTNDPGNANFSLKGEIPICDRFRVGKVSGGDRYLAC